MLILLTNDDGINAPGIQALAEELAKDFRIAVVAPREERSACSHSISLKNRLLPQELKPGWIAVNGTSADCVNLAVNKLLSQKPDLVISGINRGANLGCDVFYSGTVAGAREAVILGIPAFAVSVDVKPDQEIEYGFAAEFSRKFAHYLLGNQNHSRVIFNINFPSLPRSQVKGVRFTRQGVRVYSSSVQEYHDSSGRKFYQLDGAVLGGKRIEDSDIIAVEQGYISITPLGMDFTDYTLLSELKKFQVGDWLKID